MEAVLTIIFIFVLIIFILILNLKTFIKNELNKLNKQIELLQNQSIQTGIISPNIEHQDEQKIVEETNLQKIDIEHDEHPVKEPEKVIKKEVIEQKQFQTQNKSEIAQNSERKLFKPVKKSDFEKFIGENLMNKIGILILVIAIGLGIKYAIGEGWINAVGRILVGIITGTLLVGLAHKLRKNYIAFSSVLIGGGIAVYYFSVAFGYQMYEIFSQTQAFLLMVGITGFTVALSLAYNRKELAVLAIIGGFATPIMVSSGAGNYKVLFTYIMILDIGMLVLAYFKRWNLVNIVAYASTVLLYAIWLTTTYNEDKEIPYLGALLFATGFYLIFFFLNIINNLKAGEKFRASEFIILISNSFFYYAAGLTLLDDFAPAYKGSFTIALAVLNMLFAYPLYRRKEIDRNLVYLLIGLVLTFVSLTAPVQLNGNYITLFWAIETVLLLWLSQKSEIRLLKTTSLIIVGSMLISLLMDWDKYYFSYSENILSVILNRVFITGVVVLVALFAYAKLLANETQTYFIKKLSLEKYRRFIAVLMVVMGYFVPVFEIAYQVDNRYDFVQLSGIAIGFYTYLYILLHLIFSKRAGIGFLQKSFAWISAFLVVLYALAVHLDFKEIVHRYLDNQTNTTFALWHYLTVLMVLAMVYWAWKYLNENKKTGNVILWVLIIMSVYLLSNELDYTVLYLSKPALEQASEISLSVHKIGWPILWAVVAFVLMILGMKHKISTLRIISLSLFFFTLLKLFAVDVWDMSKGGRIAALISLGIILLVVSFLYQKLKKLIFEDESQNDEE